MWLFLWQINKSERGHEEYRKIHEEYSILQLLSSIL